MVQQTLGVDELLTELRSLLDEAVPDALWVQGEIRGLTRSRPGHLYFDLVEPGAGDRRGEARLPVALFASDRRRVEAALAEAGATPLADGLHVRVQGRVSLYVARSQVQLVMRTVDPAFTLGKIEQARRALLAALEREGLLTRNAGLSVPLLARRLALVTSATSAACADVLHELEASGLGWDVTLVDTLVQGTEAPAAIAAAIDRAAAGEVDLLMVVRGGGSRSDLAAFDSEEVARAIARCSVPVWTGIGHEIDRSVADEVAHRAHKTPTACAAAITAHVGAELDKVEGFAGHVRQSCVQALDRAGVLLTRHAHRLDRSTVLRLRSEQRHLHLMAAEIPARATRRLATATARLDVAGARRLAADPERLLARGWSITTLDDGTVVRSVHDVQTGAILRSRLRDGVLTSSILPTPGLEPTGTITTGEPDGDSR